MDELTWEYGIIMFQNEQSIRKTIIRKIPYSQVYPDIIITDIKENTGIFHFCQ
jgi:hypothetical protein